MSATGDELDKVAPKGRQEGLPDRYRQFSEADGDKLTGQVTWYDGQARPDESEMLQTLGHDPSEWKVTRIKHSRWEQKPDVWLNALGVFASRREASDPEIVAADLGLLSDQIRSWRPAKYRRPALGSGPRASFIHPIADWQAGQRQAGGADGTQARVLASLGGGIQRLEILRAQGYRIDQVVIPSLGDLLEQCQGHYASQLFFTDLNVREQRNLVWQLILKHIHAYAPMVDQLDVYGCAGNHGETRTGNAGKQETGPADNDDLLVLDVVKQILADRPGYEHVNVHIPGDPLQDSFVASGTKVGITHGHLFGKGQGSAQKAYEWIKGQQLGGGAVANCQLVLSGHLHHNAEMEFAEGLTWMQSPANDGGSAWYKASTGLSAMPGAITLLVGSDLGNGRGWSDKQLV